jgi:hypothetical protein
VSQPPLIELLYAALHSPLGVRVESNNPELLRAKLYPVMKEDEAFKALSLVLDRAAPSTHLLIVRKPNAEEVSEAHPEPPAG